MQVVSKEEIQRYALKGYFGLCYKPNVGLCGLQRFAFTIGLVYGITETGYDGRFCYPMEHGMQSTIIEASVALADWSGEGFPTGNWLKHKGAAMDERNPKYIDEVV